MISFMLEAEALSFPQKFLQGSKVLLIGMCTVFAVLAIIWFCLYLVRLLLERITQSAEKTAPAPVTAPTPVAPVAVATAPKESELIAVIAAAIAAAEAESGKTGFRVVSFRRVNK